MAQEVAQDTLANSRPSNPFVKRSPVDDLSYTGSYKPYPWPPQEKGGEHHGAYSTPRNTNPFAREPSPNYAGSEIPYRSPFQHRNGLPLHDANPFVHQTMQRHPTNSFLAQAPPDHTTVTDHIGMTQEGLENSYTKGFPNHATHNPAQQQSLTTTSLDQQQQMIDLMRAPRVEIPTFDGNPLKYFSFMRRFEEDVEKIMRSEAGKLNRLAQYCTGEAGEIIESCLLMDPTEGYKRARAILEEQFGNKFEIAQAWINKVTQQTNVKSNELRRYANNLRTCYETLKAGNCLGELESQSNLKKIMDRLPGYVQNRWRTKAAKVKRKEHRLPGIKDVVVFLEAVAFEATDPIFGVMSQTGTQTNKTTSFNITTEAIRRCAICKKDHAITSCNELEDLNYQEKIELLKTKGACFKCLETGHVARECEREVMCTISGCERRHPTLLHKETKQFVQKPPRDPEEESELSFTNAYINSAPKRIALPIVAVRVTAPGSKKYIKTYALLDSGSTNSFCTEALRNQLGVDGRAETLSVTTLEKKNSRLNTKVVTLDVADIEGAATIRLNSVYTKKHLPISKKNLATTKDISSWSHLRGIEIPLVDSDEVTLLIGQDVPDALMPLNIVSGNKGEPYATKTRLGWSLNGPIANKRETNATSYFVSAWNSTMECEDLDDKTERFWKLESGGLVEDGKKGTSFKDKVTLDTRKSTTRHREGHLTQAKIRISI